MSIAFMATTEQAGGEFSVYLDNSRAVDQRTAAYLFRAPVQVITAEKPCDIEPAFEKIRQYLADGYYVAGWISYETGLFLEKKLVPLAALSYGVPFLSFGIYKDRLTLSSRDSEEYWAEESFRGDYEIDNIRLNISWADYEAAVSRIHQFLAAGDIYQVNFTLKSLFEFSGSPESYFAALRKAQRVEYGAFIKSDKGAVLSLSPELFFRKSGRKIITRPMKGTWARGRTLSEDLRNMDVMKNDEKNRAENLMIVDLLRNDLARISAPASVKLKSLYNVEKYRTLFQMTSAIEAEVAEDVDIVDLIKTLFPCGSVTGAPKIRAMEIIAQLEKAPRGIYTGAIGYMAPGGDCCFSVPIRTLILDKAGRGEMGIGSAIVADSDVGQEYEECLLKARFATRAFRQFDLIESLRWSKEEGYYLLGLHMDRLKSSAAYFDFCHDEQSIVSDLHRHGAYLDPASQWKIRLLLSRTGKISITSSPLETSQDTKIREIILSEEVVDSQNPMFFHKTTDREFYDQQLRQHDCYDVIFTNEKGEITEGTFNNIFLKQGDILYTPPIASGVLNGTLRQSLMSDPAIRLEERCLTLVDLCDGEQIYMGNSVRGLVEVKFRALSPHSNSGHPP
ncbi:MAG: aminodeoxychorismate synthase, component I [Alphaproteobacteria bacterium]|nr:MAG: aminodeoxychorismate synthase, component I [Alphaproteobacteria bacterium]